MHDRRMQGHRRRQRMVAGFCAAANDYLQQLSGISVISVNLKEIQSLFQHEQTQFKHGLPTYAQKQEIVRLLNTSQAIVLKGGTGIGANPQLSQACYICTH